MHLRKLFRIVQCASLAGVLHLRADEPRAAAPDISTPLTAAAFDFETAERSLEKRCAEISALLGVHLSTAPSLLLVERQEVDKLLSEQEFGMSGTVTPDTAAKVGSLIGAKVLVTGRVLESSGGILVVAKVMSTETGRVFAAKVQVTGGALDSAAADLAAQIDAIIKAQATALVATRETPEARLQRLGRVVAGAKLPPVAIEIVEQHLQRPVIDPAAQTELLKLLQDLGFEILTPAQAADRPDAVIVSGEAFSELGTRRGNLVSCRARVEIAAKTVSGTLITADREMDVAVDLAEHIAGKKALASAALKLADRLVPRLAGRK